MKPTCALDRGNCSLQKGEGYMTLCSSKDQCDFKRPKIETKYVIEENKDHYVIYRGDQRTIMTAMVWDKWIAELICVTLNNWESLNRLHKQYKE